MKICRYGLSTFAGLQPIRVPAGARLNHVAVTPRDKKLGEVSLWVEVDEAAPPETLYLNVVSTGQEITGGYPTYIGTALDHPHAWHVYEVKP